MKRVHSCIKLSVSYLVLYCTLSYQQLSVHFSTQEYKLVFVPSHLSRGFSCVKSFSWSFSVDLAENWQQERCGFPRTYRHRVSASSFMQCFQSLFIIFFLFQGRWLMPVWPTCLCASHQVTLRLDNGDGVLLHRSGSGVATQRNVAHDNFTQVHILELHSTQTKGW